VSDWKALQQGVEFTLPESGLKARLRPVDFTIFAAYGQLADELLSTVLRLIQETDGATAQDLITVTGSFQNQLVQSRYLMEAYARCAFVYPRIVDVPQEEDEICAKWLGWTDLEFCYQMFNLSLPQMLTFREQQTAALLAVSDESINEKPS
jgi:hypothetical protein